MNSSLLPGSVLVGVDGSVGSAAALDWAAAHARAEHRPLAVVHAAGHVVVTDFGLDVVAGQEQLLALGHQLAQDAVARARAVAPDVDAHAFVQLGDPREVLVALAASASVLVVGSRGRGAVASLLLGSVGVALTASAPCPVVVARRTDDAPDDGPLPVVVGFDGTADSAGALTLGFELAAEQHRPLEVVAAVDDTWLYPAPELVGPEVLREATDAWQLLLSESLAGSGEKYPDVEVRTRLERGSPALVLEEASRHAALVVVGARGRNRLVGRLLGSVSRSVVEHARCTVAVVRGAGR
jgi:nucleotide-binding universal stress UspA family protein